MGRQTEKRKTDIKTRERENIRWTGGQRREVSNLVFYAQSTRATEKRKIDIKTREKDIKWTVRQRRGS